MKSIKSNGLSDLVKLYNRVNVNGCKWVFIMKKYSLGDIKRYKPRLIKGFT